MLNLRGGMVEEDKELVKNVLSGDIRSFNVIVQKYKYMVYAFVLNMIRNKDNAEDITQEVFITVYRKLYTFKQQYKFSTWLIKITRNKTIDFLRKQKFNFDIADNSLNVQDTKNLSPESYVEFKEKEKMIMEFLSLLQDKDRQIVLLKYMNRNMTFYDVSVIMNMTESSVKQKFYRTRKKLEMSLSSYEKEGQEWTVKNLKRD